ncbi:MAG: hypothetical protein J1F71_06070, partial [Clostridiales bacterium]|nr:hypothetical protein [Clostridiales bacterium]
MSGFLSLSFADAMSNIWDFVSSGYAVLVYAVLIIALIIVLGVLLMVNDGKSSDTTVITLDGAEQNSIHKEDKRGKADEPID